MENLLYEQLETPTVFINGIHFEILVQPDAEKISVMEIKSINDLNDPKLGIPNSSSECATCGDSDAKHCDGHFGVMELPMTVLNPYFVLEVVQILNKEQVQIKGHHKKRCKYCAGAFGSMYPSMTFKVSSKDIFKKAAITVEVSAKSLKKFQKKGFSRMLPADYWDFIPKDENHQHESYTKSNKRVLSPAQVHFFLKNIDREIIEKFTRPDNVFLNSFLVMPNCHRVTEVHTFCEGKQLAFDERTRTYRKLVDFKGTANELGSRVLDCLKTSRICSESASTSTSYSVNSGLRWIKDIVLGKRTDNSFRMVVVGDPGIKLSQIGIPRYIAERLHMVEQINSWNCGMLSNCCFLHYLEKGEIYIRRNGILLHGHFMNDFQIGDIIYRPLMDGDIILMNRPPSIHQHSLLALSVKILPINSVVSLNPLCCPPLRGDFDGDCLHGYIPQSLYSRAELVELIGLDKQLFNAQCGSNLLSFSHDSLTAAYLLTSGDNFFNIFEIQQLAMFCIRPLLPPAIAKAQPGTNSGLWTGNQLFSMLLPSDFNQMFPLNGVIRDGDILTPVSYSGWLRDTKNNLFNSLLNHHSDIFLDFLHHSQEALCEWLSMRGLSVSLSDIYLSPDTESREDLMREVVCGFQEALNLCHIQQMKYSMCSVMVEYGEGWDCGVFRNVVGEVTHDSVSAIRKVFRDVQTLVYSHSKRQNSLLDMFKAGSKGNLLKLVQHCMCIGLQNSAVPLSFSFPCELSCSSWNRHRQNEIDHSVVPYAVVQNSFITGLNPLEFFVNSVSSRDDSFSDNADLPGVLNRRLMFFMRDMYITYDKTVRNTYGDQLVQFCYGEPEAFAAAGKLDASEFLAGEPVGALSACAISEAAYSALDHPVSAVEESPLLNLKNILECGFRKASFGQTFSIFLSKKLGRWVHGFEYAALEIKNHLERLFFSDIVSTIMILYSPQAHDVNHVIPWVCHFHLSKEIVRRRRLKVDHIIEALQESKGVEIFSKFHLHKVFITRHKSCSFSEGNDTFCITVAVTGDSSNNNTGDLDTVRDVVIPVLLKTVIKGCAEIQRVDILWHDIPCGPKTNNISAGELYLKIFVAERCKGLKLWNIILDHCLAIMDMIDLDRSYPDDPHSVFLSYGIDAAWTTFIFRLNAALSDIGKIIIPQHLILLANSLSSTGKFVGLSARGLAEQREEMNISSPFVQACFGNPSSTFIKAGKLAAVDELRGSLDALSWGKISSFGIGPNFDILYSGKGYETIKPENIYNLLYRKDNNEKRQNIKMSNFPKKLVQTIFENSGSVTKRCTNFENISKCLKNVISFSDIQKLSHRLKVILHKYGIDDLLNEMDKATLLMALYFHPRRDQKIGAGALDIKVGYDPEYNSRCFILVRKDGTSVDFSYHKCVLGALEMIAPSRAVGYRSRWLGYHSKASPPHPLLEIK